MALSKSGRYYRDNPKAREVRDRYNTSYNSTNSSTHNARVQNRREFEKQGKVTKGDGKHIDHVDQNPNNNSSSNLRVTSAKANQSKGGKNRKKKVRVKKSSNESV